MPANLFREQHLPVSAGLTGDNTLIPAFAGGRIRVFRWYLWIPATTTLTFKDGASNALSGGMQYPANIGSVLDVSSNQEAWLDTSASNAFVMNNSAGASVAGWIKFTVE